MKRFKSSTTIFIVGAILVFAVIEILIRLGILNSFWYTIIRFGGVMAIVSLGLNLIYGFNGQFSLGQFGFYAIGAYTAADITYRWSQLHSALGLTVVLTAAIFTGIAILLVMRLVKKMRGLDPLSAFALYLIVILSVVFVAVKLGQLAAQPVTLALNLLPEKLGLSFVYLLAVLLGGVVAAEVSYLFGLPVLTLGSDYFGIATLGFAIIVKVLLDNTDTILGFDEMKGARGMLGIPKVTTWAWIFGFLFLTIIIIRNLLNSSYGRAIISVREDETAATAMGIDVAYYKIITFVIGSLFAGIAGGLYAHINGFLHPDSFSFVKSFDPLIIVVFGGLGSITGTVAASFGWALFLEGVLRLILPDGFETWRFVIYPVMLLIVMLLKPKGLFGNYEIPFLRSLVPALKKDKSNGNKNSAKEAA
ncbi:MAG: branched-chain amino acid ABC transporter permease [Anaerolineaceae bacterium]|nr:branched-chain amino acid ABC transporter permease [Anaerolineaceae bacterium]